MYKLSHSLYGDNTFFYSWLDVCNVTMDIAESHIMNKVDDMISDLADSMIETAVEVEYQATDQVQ